MRLLTLKEKPVQNKCNPYSKYRWCVDVFNTHENDKLNIDLLSLRTELVGHDKEVTDGVEYYTLSFHLKPLAPKHYSVYCDGYHNVFNFLFFSFSFRK